MNNNGIPWIVVILLLIFITPVGVILLIIKLSESNNRPHPQKRPANWQQAAQGQQTTGTRQSQRPPYQNPVRPTTPPYTPPAQTTVPPKPKAPAPAPKPIDEMDEKYLILKATAKDIVSPKVQLRAGDIANTVEKIFAHVRKYPKKRAKLNRFEHHYLPMTTHLLERYGELEKQPHKGEHISTALAQIEDALEAVDRAFKQQLDQLFSTDAMDISADIKVMEQLFEKDGIGDDAAFQPFSEARTS